MNEKLLILERRIREDLAAIDNLYEVLGEPVLGELEEEKFLEFLETLG